MTDPAIPVFQVVDLGVKGRGVRATRSYRMRDAVCVFAGPLLTLRECADGWLADHSLQIDDDLYMGPSGGVDDLFNHSCNPNCGLRIDGVDVLLVAIRHIKPGDEITFDYSTTMDDGDWEMPCACGEPGCRGVVRDYHTLPPAVRSRYEWLGVVPEFLLRKYGSCRGSSVGRTRGS